MKIDHKIIIEAPEASRLLADLGEIVNVFSSNDRDLKKDLPALMELKSLCEGIVIGEPRQRVYDKLDRLGTAEDSGRLSGPTPQPQ